MKLVTLTKISSVLVISAALCGSLANATPIAGTINFDGIATTNTGSLQTATAFTTITGVTVVPVESGNYVGTTGTPTTFTPFAFSATAVTPLWSFSIGAVNYWFDATGTISVNHFSFGGTNFLNLSGSGWAGETGYSLTAGTWSITDTSVGTETTFTFGADTTVSGVPDSGSTSLLIGLGLAGVAVGAIAQRRRLARA
jgi:hypothetical protein